MKRTFPLLLTSALLLFLLAGCSTQPPGTDTAAPPPETTSPADPVPETTAPPTTVQIAPLQITEVMPDNTTLVLDCEQDWVELYNPEDTPVSLDGYALTDGMDTLPLTGLTIPTGGYLTILLEDGGPWACPKWARPFI